MVMNEDLSKIYKEENLKWILGTVKKYFPNLKYKEIPNEFDQVTFEGKSCPWFMIDTGSGRIKVGKEDGDIVSIIFYDFIGEIEEAGIFKNKAYFCGLNAENKRVLALRVYNVYQFDSCIKKFKNLSDKDFRLPRSWELY